MMRGIWVRTKSYEKIQVESSGIVYSHVCFSIMILRRIRVLKDYCLLCRTVSRLHFCTRFPILQGLQPWMTERRLRVMRIGAMDLWAVLAFWKTQKQQPLALPPQFGPLDIHWLHVLSWGLIRNTLKFWKGQKLKNGHVRWFIHEHSQDSPDLAGFSSGFFGLSPWWSPGWPGATCRSCRSCRSCSSGAAAQWGGEAAQHLGLLGPGPSADARVLPDVRSHLATGESTLGCPLDWAVIELWDVKRLDEMLKESRNDGDWIDPTDGHGWSRIFGFVDECSWVNSLKYRC